MNSALACVIIVFLSTLSLRRATLKALYMILSLKNFYPRSPCGERPWQRGSRVTYVEISIHALLAESDRKTVWTDIKLFIFLSTLSLRRATGKHAQQPTQQGISIHALLAESDKAMWFIIGCPMLFLSTLSLRRATNTIRV